MSVAYSNAWPGILPLAVVGLAISSLFLKVFIQYWSLRHIPGPWQAKVTNFWLARKFWNKESFVDIARDLDSKYGPVVSYGPNRVLFSDPAAVPVIFNTKDHFPKAVSYETAIPVVNGQLVVTIASNRDEAKISAVKKQIIGAFTTKAILDYEIHIDHNIKLLVSRLEQDAATNDKVNIASWMTYFAFDTICRIAFSDDEGLMQKQTDLNKTLQGARERFAYWHKWQSLPYLERLLFKNSWVIAQSKKNPNTSKLGQLAAGRLRDRLEKGGLGTHTDLLDRFLQGAERAPDVMTNQTILGLVISMIHAGAETTSATLNNTLHYLMSNPQAMANLRKELSEANLSSPPQWTEVQHLRYLEACIKESGRLSPLLLDPIEREIPSDRPGVEIAGTYVPAGNIVAVNTHALNRRPEIWGPEPDEYRPERWLDSDEAQLQKMERCNLYFSGGRRVCPGMHIAWIELRKMLPELLMKFDIELSTPNQPLQSAKGTMNLFIDSLDVRLKRR